MDENDIDKSSQRANMIEQRMFEITLSSIDSLKHSAAIEIRRSQNEMKKRLRRYRDRQREIVKSRPGSNKDPIEEMMTRQMKNKAKAKQTIRPKTSPGKLQSSNYSNESQESSESDSDVEIDGTFMIDQQKSKIDLRPKTAMAISRRGVTLDQYANKGRLGTAMAQCRYFDVDELSDRGHFYMHLVDRRIQDEKCKLNALDDKVAEFCGKDTVQTIARRTQSKRKVFVKSPDRDVNVKVGTRRLPMVRSTTVLQTVKTTGNTGSSGGGDSSGTIRPNTSTGIRSTFNVKSFRKASYITTPS